MTHASGGAEGVECMRMQRDQAAWVFDLGCARGEQRTSDLQQKRKWERRNPKVR